MEESCYELLFCSWVQSRIGKSYMWWFPPRFTDCGSGHPPFLLRLASSVRPKFLAFSNKKKKSNDVVKPLFTWNNSFNLKNEHSNNIEKKRNKNRNLFYSIVHLVRDFIRFIAICDTIPTLSVYYKGSLNNKNGILYKTNHNFNKFLKNHQSCPYKKGKSLKDMLVRAKKKKKG